MKELKMFPQITEETEENLLNLEEDIPSKSPPYSPIPPLEHCSSPTPPRTPCSPNHEYTVFNFSPAPNLHAKVRHAFCTVTEINNTVNEKCRRSLCVPLSSTAVQLMTKVGELLSYGPETFELVLKLPNETIHIHEYNNITLEELGFRCPLANDLSLRKRDCRTPPATETQVPIPLPIITTENVDCPNPRHSSPPPPEDEFSTAPRVRTRSHSGGTYRLAPSIFSSGRHRRQSGDDVLTRASPTRKTSIPLQFRPRSKSDSKRPTFLTSLKNTFLGGGGGGQRKTSLGSSEPLTVEPCQFQQEDSRHPRPRSGSETKGGTMSKVIDLFRSRSHSVSYDSRGKMVLPNSNCNDDTLSKKSRKRPHPPRKI